MIDFEFSNEIPNMNDSQPLKCVDSKITEEEGSKELFIEEVPAIDRELPEELSSEHTNDQILSMTKLEDIENFMDTLLDTKYEENSLDDALQTVPHEAELSTAKPLTDVQLMSELYKINEKLSSTSECKSSIGSEQDKSEEVDKREYAESSMQLDSCIGNFDVYV